MSITFQVDFDEFLVAMRLLTSGEGGDLLQRFRSAAQQTVSNGRLPRVSITGYRTPRFMVCEPARSQYARPASKEKGAKRRTGGVLKHSQLLSCLLRVSVRW